MSAAKCWKRLNRRVVIVEDMSGTRSLLEELFQELGSFVVVAAVTGEGEAKIWLEDHPGAWDLAVVDLVLADGSGLGVLRFAMGTHPRGAVVILSGFASPSIREHCTKLGAAAVFDKADTGEFLRWLVASGHTNGTAASIDGAG